MSLGKGDKSSRTEVESVRTCEGNNKNASDDGSSTARISYLHIASDAHCNVTAPGVCAGDDDNGGPTPWHTIVCALSCWWLCSCVCKFR